jgi:hypothetical protein
LVSANLHLKWKFAWRAPAREVVSRAARWERKVVF